MKPMDSFSARVAGIKPPKGDINALILDYLTMEGYTQAAANFSHEANLMPQQSESSIRARQEIQSFIHRGQIQEAISALNDLDPEILDKDPPLHFALLRLQLVELIRSSQGGDIAPALNFATQQLAPSASKNSEFLDDLEQTMSLLFFSSDKMPADLEVLLSPDLRRDVADMVNKAILYRQTQRRDSALGRLVKLRAWSENMARDKKSDLPDRIELGLNGDDGEAMDERLNENGPEPMITI